VVAAYDTNKDLIQYSDNDDKRKLSTKVVAMGKNLQGVTISVMVAGVHAYDNDTQFFEDSTFITLKSEGPVYKNNYLSASKSVTVFPQALYKAFTTSYASYPTRLNIGSGDIGNFPVNSLVYFTRVGGTLPSNITESGAVIYRYYVVSNNGVYIELNATTPGGAAMDIGSDASGTVYINHDGGLQFNNADLFLTASAQEIYFSAATVPGGLALGTPYYAYPAGYVHSTFWCVLFTDRAMTEGTRPSISSAGTTVKIMRTSDIGNFSSLGATPKVWLYGWDYAIPTGSVIALSIPYDTAVSRTTSGAPTEGLDSNGVQYTEVVLTEFPTSDFSGNGFFLNRRLYVDDASMVGNNEVLIGEEKITIDSNGTDTTYGDYIQFADVTARVTSATLKCYPHGVGALVSRTNYTEASPQTNSPIDLYGVYIDNRTVDGNVTFGTLDTYASGLLLGLGNFYKKATTWGSLEQIYVKRVGEFYAGLQQVSLATPLRTADRISTTEYTGATPEEIQVVETTLICDEGRMLLNLGDFERNVFTTMQSKTAAINRPLT
jgi:hypothetical protein